MVAVLDKNPNPFLLHLQKLSGLPEAAEGLGLFRLHLCERLVFSRCFLGTKMLCKSKGYVRLLVTVIVLI